MNGFFGLTGIVWLVVILILFGGAVFDLTTTGARCGLSVATPNMNYTCDEFGGSILRTIVTPDDNIAKGTTGIMALDSMSDEKLAELGVMRASLTQSFTMQIIMGIAGLLIMLGVIFYALHKFSMGSTYELGALILTFLFAVIILAMISIFAGSSIPEHGNYAIFGEMTPFRGARLLLANTDVLFSVIDETSVLPGTMTTDNITGGAT